MNCKCKISIQHESICDINTCEILHHENVCAMCKSMMHSNIHGSLMLIRLSVSAAILVECST
jgi:hypothetical protein